MNLEKYVDAFCFSRVYLSNDGEQLFYLWQKNDVKNLYTLSLNDSSRLLEGTLICEKDFSLGSFNIRHFDVKRKILYLILDDCNKENFNLWKLDLNTRDLVQLTHFQYASGVTFNEDNSLCWCFSKKKQGDGTFNSEAFQIDLTTLAITFLFSDVGQDYRIGWTVLAKVPESDQFVFTVDFLNQRKKTNICLYSIAEKKWNRLLPPELEELGNPSVCEENPGADGVLIESVHEGFQNIYFCAFKDGKLKKITDLGQKNEGMSIVKKGQATDKSIRIVLKVDNKFFLKSYDLEGRQKSVELPAIVNLFDTQTEFHGILSGPDSTNKIVELSQEGKILKTIDLSSVPSTELENTKSSWVSYPSFDGKNIKAILHLPKTEVKAVAIMAFYGGNEWYSSQIQRYAEMGLAVLSPAVRGSWGWGREWEKMLEGDLGGNEILDVIWGAKFLEATLGLPPAKIGVFGGSHGGFATLRAITMPADYNSLKETYYPFGFAISEVGFADLMAFHQDSRIADWLVHLLGPVDEKKYAERSPLTFFDNLETPLLIINGKNDSRVPYSTMKKFIEKLKNSSKDYHLLIHETQGHGTSNRSTTLLEYQTEQKFLERFV